MMQRSQKYELYFLPHELEEKCFVLKDDFGSKMFGTIYNDINFAYYMAEHFLYQKAFYCSYLAIDL